MTIWVIFFSGDDSDEEQRELENVFFEEAISKKYFSK